MPRKNTIKTYVENGYYHIYNRGVDKKQLFLDEQDHAVFLRFLKEYLLPPNHPALIQLRNLSPKRKPINCFHQIKLLAFCLMPNHFHLFVQQLTKDGLTPFMKAVCTNFSMYFNRKYDRIGHLFESTYKAALVETEPYYLHVTRYIHRNPKPLLARDNPLHIYPYSSYPYYLGAPSPIWLHTSPILSFSRTQRSLFPKDILSYQSFVENEEIDETEILGELTLEK